MGVMFVVFLGIACWDASALSLGSSSSQGNNLNYLHVDEMAPQVTISIRNDLFRNSRDVLYYAVLVSSRGSMESPITGKWNGEDWPDLRVWEEAVTENGTVLTYQTTPVKWEPFANRSKSGTVTFTIGTGECDSFNYCNKPLKEKCEYALKIRAFTGKEFQDTDVLYFKTSGRLPVGFISLVLGGIFLVGAISTIFSAIPPDVLCFRLLSFRNSTSPSTIFFKSYSPARFQRHANDLIRTTGRLSNEFHLLGTLSANLTTPCLHAQRIDNREKNRYGDVLPFDVTRVELRALDGDPSTDYINASYIKGHQQQIEYIAAQGPKHETCHDFYRMIIEQNVELVIMLTDLEENGTELCYKYYPDVGSTLRFRDVEVYCKFEREMDFCVRRRLVVRSHHGEHEVVHLHFEGWPDFSCPEDGTDVVKLCEYTRQIPHDGYILVHGTAGTGRCGTFIALDILLQSVRNNEKISVFKTVLELRQQRVNMVQTLDQYGFIYKCIAASVNSVTGKCKSTEL